MSCTDTQWHFFAGIGGWPYALRLAGWHDNWPVLTGSPPCQPFSAAGKRRGVTDERHLAPVWLRIVKELRPPVVFGEQVAGAITLHDWLDDLLDALEMEGYAAGAVVLPACSVGAPHLRQRLWFFGDILGDASGARLAERARLGGDVSKKRPALERAGRSPHGVAYADSRGFARQRLSWRRKSKAAWGSALSVLADADGERGHRATEVEEQRWRDVATRGGVTVRASAHHGGWDAADWLLCRDGAWRPVEPGTFPLVDGVPGRVGRLRAYGNAIVPQVAAEVVKAWMEVRLLLNPARGLG